MADGDQAKAGEGRREDPAAAIGADRERPGDLQLGPVAGLGQAMAELVAIRQAAGAPEADAAPALPGLVDEADAGADLVARAAETANSKRRARGRPKGAANLRNAALFDWLEALGHKNPVKRLVEIISADPRELARALAGPNAGEPSYERALDVLREQRQAAAALLPYVLAKKPQAIEVTSKELHLFLAGSLGGNADIADRFDVLHQIEENQGVSGDGAGKSDGQSRTEAGKPSDTSGLGGE